MAIERSGQSCHSIRSPEGLQLPPPSSEEVFNEESVCLPNGRILSEDPSHLLPRACRLVSADHQEGTVEFQDLSLQLAVSGHGSILEAGGRGEC